MGTKFNSLTQINQELHAKFTPANHIQRSMTLFHGVKANSSELRASVFRSGYWLGSAKAAFFGVGSRSGMWKRCFGQCSDDGDGLMWTTDLKQHASGDFSIAVVQANWRWRTRARSLPHGWGRASESLIDMAAPRLPASSTASFCFTYAVTTLLPFCAFVSHDCIFFMCLIGICIFDYMEVNGACLIFFECGDVFMQFFCISIPGCHSPIRLFFLCKMIMLAIFGRGSVFQTCYVVF